MEGSAGNSVPQSHLPPPEPVSPSSVRKPRGNAALAVQSEHAEPPFQKLVAMSEAQLEQLSDEKAAKGLDRGIDCSDWTKQPAIQVKELMGKLRRVQDRLDARSAQKSAAVDLDYVSKKLAEVPEKSRSPLDPSFMAGSPSDAPDFMPDDLGRKQETEAYDQLIREGGRPLYPIHLLHEVSQNPESFREMLLPWQDGADVLPLDWFDIFHKQLKRWRDFRQWQQDNRGMVDDSLSTFKEKIEREEGKISDLYPLHTDSEQQTILQQLWASDKERRGKLRRLWIEGSYGDEFSKYTEAVMQRLASHGFSRAIHLQKDPQCQDKLTEWIEYLSFEFWWHDRFANFVERLQLHHNEAWQRLVESAGLEPHETEEYLRRSDYYLEYDKEERKLREALKVAQSATETARNSVSAMLGDPQHPGSPQSNHHQATAKAQAAVDVAQKNFESFHERQSLISKFFKGSIRLEDYEWRKEAITLLLPWIMEQVPLIEAEAERSSDTHSGVETPNPTKRRLDDEDNNAHEKAHARKKTAIVHTAPEPGKNDLARQTTPPEHCRTSERDDITDPHAQARSPLHEDVSDGRATAAAESAPSREPEQPAMAPKKRSPPNRLKWKNVEPTRRSARIAARQAASAAEFQRRHVSDQASRRTSKKSEPASAPPKKSRVSRARQEKSTSNVKGGRSKPKHSARPKPRGKKAKGSRRS